MPMIRATSARAFTAATALLLVVGLAIAGAYPHVAAPRATFPLPPDAVWASLRAAAPVYGVLAAAAWAASGRRLATSAAALGTLLTVGLGVALYAVALDAASPTAPARALRLVPLRQLAAAAITAYAVYLARRASRR